MYKHILAAIFVLMAVFSCDSPYAIQFQNEHREYPPGDPEVAALLHPTLSGRIEYSFFKQVCPSKPLKSVEKAAKFIIASGFVKKALPNILGTPGVVLLPAISVAAAQMVSDSLSPEAMSYETTKDAMAAAIGTAMVSDYSCESVESAARTYYAYDKAAYVSDLCGNGNTIKTIVKNLKKSRGEVGLIAVPFKSPIPPSFTEIYSRDSRIGELLRKGIITRSESLGMMVRELDGLPLCHEVTNDFMSDLKEMARLDDLYFFSLYDAVKEFRENCPIEISGAYVLQEIDEKVLIFTDESGAEIPLVIVNDEGQPEKMVRFDIDGPLPMKGDDVWIDEIGVSKEVPAERLNVGYLAIIPLVALLGWGWMREKKT